MTRRGVRELPPWCGYCSEQGRLLDLAPDLAGRCPNCHPARQPGGRHYTPLPGRTIPVTRQDRLAVALPEDQR